MVNDETEAMFSSNDAALSRCHEILKWLDAVTDSKNLLLDYIKYVKVFYKELRCVDKNIIVKNDIKRNTVNNLRYRLLSGDSIDSHEQKYIEDWEDELREIHQDLGMNITIKKSKDTITI
jgi:hypothetical protein